MIIKEAIIPHIKALQDQNPGLLLCGSVALILSGLLENRAVSDIDFTINYKDINATFFKTLKRYPYSMDNSNDNYISYKHGDAILPINILAFEDGVVLNSENIEVSPGLYIKCQSMSDIIYWKEKYNRFKDKEDLDKITMKIIETTIL